MERSLRGKVSLICGGFESIGASIANRFAADGSIVILLYSATQKPFVQYVADSINAQKVGIAVAAEVDFPALCRASGERTADESVNRVLDDTLRAYGQVDVLVHADDGIATGTLTDIDDVFIDTMIRTNVKEPLFLSKFVARHMREGGLSLSHPV